MNSRFNVPLQALIIALAMLVATPTMAGSRKNGPLRQAIVLAAFGTSYPEALGAILNIKDKVKQANPDIPVKLAFTSSIIRKKWKARQDDAAWKKNHPGIPEEVLFVKSPLATIADLQNDGYEDIAVQSLHVFAGEEFEDLKSMLIGLDSIRTIRAKHQPFKKLRLGRPALGMPGSAYPYKNDVAAAAKALKKDVDDAKAMGAALVYMGHGNEVFSTGSYFEFQQIMQHTYDYPVFVSCVEGSPNYEDLLVNLKAAGRKKVLLKPFMIVAGDHASNDMAGDEEDSWKVLLTKAGYTVKTELRGLGSVDQWADIYVNNLKDALSQKRLLF